MLNKHKAIEHKKAIVENQSIHYLERIIAACECALLTDKHERAIWIRKINEIAETQLTSSETCATHELVAENEQLRSRLNEIMSAIRYCAGELEFDSYHMKEPDGYCSECCQNARDGHNTLCWRRYAFVESE